MRCSIVALTLACAVLLPAQDVPLPRTFSLSDRLTVTLNTDWTERRNEDLPPPNLLVASAPKFLFSDILVVENRHSYEALKVLISENPFLGSTSAALDTRMRASGGAGMAAGLFYLFFPPPRTCLAEARAALEQERRREAERLAKLKEQDRVARLFSASRQCLFAATPLDLFAEQVSPGVVLESGGGANGMPRNFFVPSMEQIEREGKTFFIFEAQGQRMLDRPDLDHYSLREELRGARAHVFWAIGADSPFPFFFDAARKNVQLYHVVLATLSTTGTATRRFHEVLERISFSKP